MNNWYICNESCNLPPGYTGELWKVTVVCSLLPVTDPSIPLYVSVVSTLSTDIVWKMSSLILTYLIRYMICCFSVPSDISVVSTSPQYHCYPSLPQSRHGKNSPSCLHIQVRPGSSQSNHSWTLHSESYLYLYPTLIWFGIPTYFNTSRFTDLLQKMTGSWFSHPNYWIMSLNSVWSNIFRPFILLPSWWWLIQRNLISIENITQLVSDILCISFFVLFFTSCLAPFNTCLHDRCLSDMEFVGLNKFLPQITMSTHVIWSIEYILCMILKEWDTFIRQEILVYTTVSLQDCTDIFYTQPFLNGLHALE